MADSASGVRTALGGLYTGALVLLCLAFLMPYTAFIPKVSCDWWRAAVLSSDWSRPPWQPSSSPPSSSASSTTSSNQCGTVNVRNILH